MKLQSLLLAVLASSTGLATPLRVDVKQPIYNLRLTSPVPSLNGAYLSVTKGSLLSVSAAAPASARVQVYAVSNPATGLSELRTVEAAVPNGPGPRPSADGSPPHKTLALVGKDGLLDLASLADPAAVAAPPGGTVDWTSFRLDERGRQVTYAGGGGGGGSGDGRWVVFPAGDGAADWVVKWKGADVWTTEDYMPVQVVYELV